MNDRERLARIFGVTLTDPTWPLVGAMSLVVVIPVVAIAATAGTAAVFGGMRLADDRKVRRGLREVDGWGFPVTGYRDWLLAAEPAFDLELARDISIEVIRGSIEAVDRTAVVEKRGDRVVRVVTRLVQVANAPRTEDADSDIHSKPNVIDVADRRLLFELRDRILGPLHADSGIVAMRMGERSKLGALVPAAKKGGDGAFRDQALVAPPALQQLVVAKTAQTRPPNEASKRNYRWERVLVAMGESRSVNISTVIGWGATPGLALVFLIGPLAFVASAAGAVMATRYTLRSRRARVQRFIDDVNRYGFPVEGFEDYVISGRPIFDVELARAAPRKIVEDLLGRNDFQITWIDDTLVRIETPPRLIVTQNLFEPFWGGDPRHFIGLIGTFLVPLHAQVGIVAVRMGGYVARRA